MSIPKLFSLRRGRDWTAVFRRMVFSSGKSRVEASLRHPLCHLYWNYYSSGRIRRVLPRYLLGIFADYVNWKKNRGMFRTAQQSDINGWIRECLFLFPFFFTGETNTFCHDKFMSFRSINPVLGLLLLLIKEEYCITQFSLLRRKFFNSRWSCTGK